MDDSVRQRSVASAGSAGERVRDLWAHVRETVLSVDAASGRIESASSSWRSYGQDPEQLVGRTLTTLIHPEDRAAFEAYLLRPDLAEDAPAVPARMRCGDGSWLGSVARVHHVAEGDAPLIVSFLPLDDVTARTFAQERRAADQLRLVDEMKHHLLEVVSHELRTPLTVVGGFGQTLQREDATFDADSLRRIGASIERHAARLEAVVADLVDLDRSTRGRFLEDRESLDLADLVQDVADGFDLDARPLQVEATPVTVPVDRAKVTRIVECLLDNARRHTPPGTNVRIRVAPSEGGALLEVCDDGPGLAGSLRAEVFSAFAQGRLRDDASPGLGIGLALVRRFTELHGGRCWHSQPEGGGSRFCVHLPGSAPPDDPFRRLEDQLRSVRTRESVLLQDGPAQVVLPPETLRTVDAMLRTVRRELGMQVAYLSTFTATEQVVVATSGDGEPLGIRPDLRIPLEDTYCVRMIRGQVPHLVIDTREDTELADLPATAAIACYVGVPVHLPDGHVVGSLCCADGEPRPELAASQTAVLRTVAELIGEELAHHHASATDRHELTQRIRQVLQDRDGIRAVYQPIVELATGEVVGVEALSRFPDSQLRPPDLWFADAARIGMAGQLEQTAVVHALGGLRHLPDDRYLSLNLSPGAITTGGLRPLLGRVPLHRIVIEITEHAAVDDYDQVGALLRPFRDGGVRLAIDDVGAGFASLRHVLRMGPDIIKLDRSLVSQITTDPAQHAIATAFAQLATRLGATLVAEGIEDAQTLHALTEAGITHGQGWLFDRPGPLPLATLTYPIPAAPEG